MTLYRIDKGDTYGLLFGKLMVVDEDAEYVGKLVPVEPDYEAAAKVLQSDESMTSWLMWATTIVDAAVGEETPSQHELGDDTLGAAYGGNL